MKLSLIIYFFSNFLLVFFGFLFLLPIIVRTKSEYDILKKYIFGNIIHVFTGIIGIILGFIVLIFPYDKILIIGDLVPAMCIFLISVTLIFGYIRISQSIEHKMLVEGQIILEKFQIPIGMIGIIAGTGHIFFPGIPLL